MKKVLLMMLILLLIGCAEEPLEVLNKSVKSVKTLEVIRRDYQDYEKYIGHVKSSGTVKTAFEVDGKLLSVTVQSGDLVEAGDLLAMVDTEGYQFSLDAAKAELSAARAQYNKALESLSYVENLYNDTKNLYESGVSSKADFDQVKLNYDLSQSEVNSARQMVNQASTNVEVKNYMMDQTSLFASKSGIVVDVLYEEGELVASGYPVVILRDEFPLISFGLAQDDLSYVAVGNQLILECDNAPVNGDVISVEQVPDRQTQTYEVEMKVEKDLALGAIVTVIVPTEYVNGSMIPLGAIRSDGEDYVFIVTDDYAERLTIEVVAIFNQEVVVTGLPENVQLITDGILGLSAGDLIKIVED